MSPVKLAVRTLLMTSDLPGYTEYMQQVRYRLAPRVW